VRKIFIALVLLGLMVSPAFSAQTSWTMIDDETLAYSNYAEEADRNIEDAQRITFFVTYDSSRTTAAVTAVVTAAMSVDGTNWQDISWFDVAGGGTPQTSETLSTDTTYIGWVDPIMIAPYMRIRVTLPNYLKYGPTDTADVTVTLVETK
jgi:hypothetical protein